MTAPPLDPPRSVWRRVGRVAAFIAVAVASAWLLAAFVLWILRCDESCSGDEASSWTWHAG